MMTPFTREQLAKARDVHVLHRYFIWADQMRINFFEKLNESPLARLGVKGTQLKQVLDQLEAQPGAPEETIGSMFIRPYMSYFFGGMFVVIEGWMALGLTDPRIDALLDSPNVDLLRRHRNGAFHFQREYFAQRLLGFVVAAGSAAWIHSLTDEFGRWFLEFFEAIGQAERRP